MDGKKLITVGVLLSSLLMAQEPHFSEGDAPLPRKEHCPTYSYPAAVNLDSTYQFLISASYTYWYAGEDGLDLATTALFDNSSGQVLPSTTEMRTILQDFQYASGFKVGVGMDFNFDNWEVRLDYTYHRQDSTGSSSAPTLSGGTGVLFSNNWYIQSSGSGQALSAQKLSSRWHLGIDWIDATLSRGFYQGRSVTMRPYVGLRTSWIRQNLRLTLSDIVNITPISAKIRSHNHSNCWGIGPRTGLEVDWLLGYGIGFRVNGGASLLYTQYTSVKHTEGPFVAGATSLSNSSRDVNTVRPMLEAGLGLGWGYYFGSKYHLDLAASYDFNYLWGQNMMRQLMDMYVSGTSAQPGSLYLHGLTITARFDF